MYSKYEYFKTKPGIILIIPLFAVLFFVVSCKKYLDEKPVKSEQVPSTLNHLLDLLNNQMLVNDNSPGLTELLADNYYITDAEWQTRISSAAPNNISMAQHYIWEGQALPEDESWISSYQGPIYTANLVLDHLPIVSVAIGEEQKFNYVKGAAIFYRAFAFQQLSDLYGKPYEATTAANDLGVVLRITSNINSPSERSTVQQNYDFILNSLKDAAALLPESTNFPTQPNKTAAYGALARTYLNMRQYDSAGYYANKALQMYGILMDYNNVSTPIQTFNPEVIYHDIPNPMTILSNTRARIDSNLYRSYSTNDRRRTVFFQANTGAASGSFRFRGGYHGNNGSLGPGNVFTGITTGELYLIRAEAYAKAGNISAAITDLNTLMQKRWVNNGTWIPFTADNATEALQVIRTERRKELIFRGLRWSDIRRYNLEDSAITLKRVISGITYSLPPNDKRSVMLIPWDVINRSGIEQNPR